MRRSMCVSVLALACTPVVAFAGIGFQDNFDLDSSANYNVFTGATTGGFQGAATFAFDYSTVGIPAAPGSSTTFGLKMEANYAGGIFGGISASVKDRDFIAESPNGYVLKFNVWQNTIGPMPLGGSGSTQLATYGIGTSGNQSVTPIASDAIFFASSGEGGTAIDYRVYTQGGAPLLPSTGAYFAGTNNPSVEPPVPDPRNNTDPYYSMFGGNQPPAAQTALFAQQTGATAVGTQAFAWQEVRIDVSPTTGVLWRINGVPIGKVDSAVLNGNAPDLAGTIFFGQSDINAGSSTDPNVRDLLFGLFDNVTLYTLGAKGDVNDDGNVNNLDIAPFVATLTGGGTLRPDIAFAADVNGDGVVNNLDIAPFVALLTGGRPVGDDDPEFGPLLALVPEPASLSLLALGGLMLGRRRRA